MISSTSRVTRGHSCGFCQQRKVRSDGHRPCSTCLRNGQECIRRVGSKSHPPRDRPQSRDAGVTSVTEQLARRLELCERAVKAHGISLEPETEADRRPVVRLMPNASWPVPEGQLIKETTHARYVEKYGEILISPYLFSYILPERTSADLFQSPLWQGLTNELDSCRSVADESENESLPNADAGTLLFQPYCPKGVRSLHPNIPQNFQLGQIFLNNVNPIVKLLHAPSTQQLILEAASDFDNISRPTEALLFSIYLCAVASMDDESSRQVLGASRADLMARFSRATEQALINAGFLRSTNVLILQALTLYSVRNTYLALGPA